MISPQDYNACLKDMFELRRFGIKLGLSTIRHILEKLGNPQEKFQCIHVAGTNGKGSVASTLAAVLTTCGYKTGLYTSPHLVRFNERIVVDNDPISDEQVVASYHAIKRLHEHERQPTFFEFTTAMALHEFARQRVDWAVIETGMGGRLDATNVISPAVCIITNISLEHREYLGNTIAKIAAEKAGIIKRATPLVTGVRQKDAIKVITQIATSRSAPIHRLGRDFRIRRREETTFDYRGINAGWSELRTPLAGDYQLDNAALSLAACDVLNPDCITVTEDCIRKGLLNTRWPGRLECISEDPFVLLDGAHNLVAARRLAEYLVKYQKHRKIVLVIGILSDKPYRAMLRSLIPVCDRVVITRPKINRALPPETLMSAVCEQTERVEVIADVAKAVAHALETATPDAAVCIAGSLYVVGEAKEALQNMGYGADRR
jgi:dihydrofolate synthase/folylpolyglutamate synthase